ncbi:hypothetical protein [Brevundimonas sp.]|uniref:hypothetical protein n=1 Tax=Brevundimonas sp. TaxID=1871086 RepID=UPI003D13D4FE
MPDARPIPLSMILRQTHNIVGMVIAPSILMFAVTGGLQVFRLNESHAGYTAPLIVQKLGRVHKDQVFAVKPPKPPRVQAPGAPKAESADRGTPLSNTLLQWFFVLVSVGLFVSTLLGIWMGATMGRLKIAARWALLAGTVIPVAILLLP